MMVKFKGLFFIKNGDFMLWSTKFPARNNKQRIKHIQGVLLT